MRVTRCHVVLLVAPAFAKGHSSPWRLASYKSAVVSYALSLCVVSITIQTALPALFLNAHHCYTVSEFPMQVIYAVLSTLLLGTGGGGSSVPNILSQKRLVTPKPFS